MVTPLLPGHAGYPMMMRHSTPQHTSGDPTKKLIELDTADKVSTAARRRGVRMPDKYGTENVAVLPVQRNR